MTVYGGELLLKKYGLANYWETRMPISLYGVSCWRGIVNHLEDFKKVIRAEVGSGRGASFWNDKW